MSFCLILVMSVGMFIVKHGLNNWLPEILRTGGMDAATAGYWASIPTAVGIFAALTIPRFATEERRILLLGILIVAAGVATMPTLQPVSATTRSRSSRYCRWNIQVLKPDSAWPSSSRWRLILWLSLIHI